MAEIAAWPEVQSGLKIGCDAGAIFRIRSHAADEIAARRTAAGLLLGERAGLSVRILGAMPLEMTSEQIRLARYRISVEGLAVIGWYVARPDGEKQLTASERVVFHQLFPTEWQITLLLKPADDGGLQAAFFFRDAAGGFQCSDMPLPEPTPPPQPHPPEPPDPAPVLRESRRSESRAVSIFGWLLIAVVASLAGAATYGYQHRQTIHLQIPHIHMPALKPKLIP